MKLIFLFGVLNHVFPTRVHQQPPPHRSPTERSFGVIAIALRDGRRRIEETLDCIHTDSRFTAHHRTPLRWWAFYLLLANQKNTT